MDGHRERLRQGGLRGCIDIEGWHGLVYKDALEMTGQIHALDYLKHCRAAFIPNPQGDFVTTLNAVQNEYLWGG